MNRSAAGLARVLLVHFEHAGQRLTGGAQQVARIHCEARHAELWGEGGGGEIDMKHVWGPELNASKKEPCVCGNRIRDGEGIGTLHATIVLCVQY